MAFARSAPALVKITGAEARLGERGSQLVHSGKVKMGKFSFSDF
jgi:hypothetical protein